MRSLLITILLASTPALAGALSLDKLQQAMRDADVDWKPVGIEPKDLDARLIGVGGLIDEDEAPLRTLIGGPQLTASDDDEQAEAQRAGPMPASFDWRNRSGISYMPPATVRQGDCGSCVSFATMAALEARLNIVCETPRRSFDLSRQHFFSCGGGNCKSGWKLSDAVDYLVDAGVPDTSCLQYASTNGRDVSCSEACSDAPSRSIKGFAYTRPTTGFVDVEAIKRALVRGPLVSNMLLFEDLALYDSGVYRHVAGAKIGSHAIVLVGWSDAERAWIARNSWGEGWGDAGYFKVAWDDESLPGRYTWAIDVTDGSGSGICTSPR